MNETSESNVNDTMPVRDQYLARIEVTILSVMFTVTVIGNVLALIALGARRRRQLSRMHYFILHLCISDLAVAFFCILSQLILDIFGKFIGGFPGDNVLCKFLKYGQVFAPYISSYVLIMTAIDRYQAICFPLRNCSWTARRSKIMIACAWIISAVFSSPQLFIFSYTRVPPNNNSDCWGEFIKPWGEKAYVMYSMMSLFIIPLLILIFTYSCICRTIWVNFKNTSQAPRQIAQAKNDEKERELLNGQILNNIGNSYANGRKMSVIDDDNETTEFCSVDSTCKNNDDASSVSSATKNRARSNSTRPPVHPIRSHNSNTRISRAKIKTVKLTVAVILCYVACSLPFFTSVMYVTWFVESVDFFHSYAYTIMALLLSLNSCVNPWLYLVFNENMARTLRDLLCHCEKNETSNGTQIGAPFSRGSVSESRLATILTLSRIHCNQMELKSVNSMNAVNGSLKVPNTEEKPKLVNHAKVTSGQRGSLTSFKLKNNNCNIISYPGHKCIDSRVVHNCKQL